VLGSVLRFVPLSSTFVDNAVKHLILLRTSFQFTFN